MWSTASTLVRVIVRGYAAHEDRRDRRARHLARPKRCVHCSPPAPTSCDSTPRTARAEVHARTRRVGTRHRGPARVAPSACSSTCPVRRCAPGPSSTTRSSSRSASELTLTADAGRRRHAPRLDHAARAGAMGRPRRRGLPRRRRDRAARRPHRRRRRRVRDRAGRRAAFAQGHARAARRSRTSSRSPRPTRSRSAWRSRSRPTSSVCRSCAVPKTSRRVRARLPKRGTPAACSSRRSRPRSHSTICPASSARPTR